MVCYWIAIVYVVGTFENMYLTCFDLQASCSQETKDLSLIYFLTTNKTNFSSIESMPKYVD